MADKTDKPDWKSLAKKYVRGSKSQQDGCDDPCGCSEPDDKKPDKGNLNLSTIRDQIKRVSRETQKNTQDLRRVNTEITAIKSEVRRTGDTVRATSIQAKRTASEVLRVRADLRKVANRVDSLEIRHTWYAKAFTNLGNDIRKLRMDIEKLKNAPKPEEKNENPFMMGGGTGPGWGNLAGGLFGGLGVAAAASKFKGVVSKGMRGISTAARKGGFMAGRGAARFIPGVGLGLMAYDVYSTLDSIGESNEARDRAAGITKDDINAERGAGTFAKTEIERKRQEFHRSRKRGAYDDLKAETARLKRQAAEENGYKHRQRYNRWRKSAVDVNDGRHMLASNRSNMQVPQDFLNSGQMPGGLTFRDQYERSQIEDQKSQFIRFGQLPTGFEFLEGHMGRLGTAGALRAAGIQHATGPESLRTFPGSGQHSGSYTMPTGGGFRAPGNPGTGSPNLNSGPTAPFKPMGQGKDITISAAGYGTNAQQAIEKLAAERGWTKEGTAALLANIKQESSFNPYTIGDGGKSFGLFQMNGFGSGRGPTRIGALEQVMKEKTGLQDPLGYIRDVQAGRIKPDPKITEGMIAAQVEHFVYRDVDKSINNDNVQRGLQSTDVATANRSILSAIRPDNWNKQREGGWEWRNRLGSAQNYYRTLDLDKWKTFQGAQTAPNPPTGPASLMDDRIPNKTRLPGGEDAMRLRRDFEGSVLHKTPLTLEQLKEGADPRSKAYGYHTAIDEDGNVHELRGYDVRSNHITSTGNPSRVGAQHLNNYNAYGVALTGSGKLNDRVKQALIHHYATQIARGVLPANYMDGTRPTYGHGEIQNDGGRPFLDRGRAPEGSEAAKYLNENWGEIVKQAEELKKKVNDTNEERGTVITGDMLGVPRRRSIGRPRDPGDALLLPGATRYGNQRDDRGILDRENASEYYRRLGHSNIDVHDRTGKTTILERIMKSKGPMTISAFSDGAKDLAKVWDQIPDEKKKQITVDMVGANDVAQREQFKGAGNIRVNPQHDNAYRDELVRMDRPQQQGQTGGARFDQRLVDSITGSREGTQISNSMFGTEGAFKVTDEQNRNRPDVIRGRISLGKGHEFDVITGGSGRQSAPLGIHNLSYQQSGSTILGYSAHLNTTSKYHSWNVGSDKYGVTGVADPKVRTGTRSEIQIHIGGTDDLNRLRSAGCLAIPPSQYPAFVKRMQELMREKGGKLFLRIAPPGKDGISRMSVHGPDDAFNDPKIATMSAPEFAKNMGLMTSTAERENTPYGDRPKFDFAENSGLEQFNQRRPELLQNVERAAQAVPGITLDKAPQAVPVPSQPTEDGVVPNRPMPPVMAPQPGPQAVPDWGKNWAAEATPKSDVPPMTMGPFAPPADAKPGQATQPLTEKPSEALTGPTTQNQRRQEEAINNPGNANGPGGSYPSNNPESQPEGPGSAGMGSYGRCFI